MELSPVPWKSGVDVEVGRLRVDQRRTGGGMVCILGIAPPGFPWLADLMPYARVRDTRLRNRDASVEQFRFMAGHDISGLPGLDGEYPSRIRDSVRLALAAGCPSVDVLMLRCGNLAPWDLDGHQVIEYAATFLEDLHGAIMILPDAGGPFEVTPHPTADLETRRDRLVRTIKSFAPGLAERYQLGLVDNIDQTERQLVETLQRVGNADVGMVRWQGSPLRMESHGWRCGAAAVAGALKYGGTRNLTMGVAGRRVALGPGRAVRGDRRFVLKMAEVETDRPAFHQHCISLELQGNRNVGQIRSEPTLRRPLGHWPLPALRTVKEIHYRLVRAAEPFVFRPVQPPHALALAASVSHTIAAFVREGILVGPGGLGGPKVSGDVDADPRRPSLIVNFEGRLQPWCYGVKVKVMARTNSQPVVEIV